GPNSREALALYGRNGRNPVASRPQRSYVRKGLDDSSCDESVGIRSFRNRAQAILPDCTLKVMHSRINDHTRSMMQPYQQNQSVESRRAVLTGAFAALGASASDQVETKASQAGGSGAQVAARDRIRITKLETLLVKPRWLFLKVHTDAGIIGLGEPIVEGRA